MSLSQQEVYAKVKKHLLTQNAKALLGTGCAYRTSEGLTCAVGCLIPEEIYTPEIENKGLSWLGIRRSLERGGIEYNHLSSPFEKDMNNLLRELQIVHDQWPVSAWPEKLTRTARKFGLNP